MAAQKQDDQHERTFSSYVRIQVAVLKTYLGRWTIGRSGERGSGISVLPARYDDDDIYIYIGWVKSFFNILLAWSTIQQFRGHLVGFGFMAYQLLPVGNSKSLVCIYIYLIYMIWFDVVLWHINHCRLFNAKYSLFIYIKYIWFDLVGFYSISTIIGYLMPNIFKHIY